MTGRRVGVLVACWLLALVVVLVCCLLFYFVLFFEGGGGGGLGGRDLTSHKFSFYIT